MSDYEEDSDEDFEDGDDQDELDEEFEDDDGIDQDEFETCGYCDGAGSLISLLGHSHGTCSYCYGSGIQPRDRH